MEMGTSAKKYAKKNVLYINIHENGMLDKLIKSNFIYFF